VSFNVALSGNNDVNTGITIPGIRPQHSVRQGNQKLHPERETRANKSWQAAVNRILEQLKSRCPWPEYAG
jgi:hypothetical protein